MEQPKMHIKLFTHSNPTLFAQQPLKSWGEVFGWKKSSIKELQPFVTLQE